MITRKRILALLFTAICLLGILPLSVSAFTPVVEGATYTYYEPFGTPMDENQFEPYLTPISGTLNYFTCSGSPDIPSTVIIDVFSSEITEIGYIHNLDYEAVVMKVNLTASAYIPSMSSLPILFSNQPATLEFMQMFNDPRISITAIVGDTTLRTFVTIGNSFSFTLNAIFNTTDLVVLDNTLKDFTTELTVDNYVDWMLDGYNRIINVFVNNAKVQYVMDNPIFIIALVVFAMAIAFAIASFIFKIFRRY